jgi:hypothetical protein
VSAGDDVAAGVLREEILRSYAALTDLDIDATLAYAAELTREAPWICRWKSKLEVQSRRESSNRIHVHLMTLNLDFANVQACPPKAHPGIVVFRPESQDKPTLVAFLKRLVSVLLQLSPKHQL